MEVHYLSLLEVSERIRRQELTSEGVTEALLARIAHLDVNLHATLLVMADLALEQARRADAEIAAGQWRGPLHGVPIGLKDTVWTKGLPTTAGMELWRDFRPQEDATVVRRLKEAGAVLIAKLATTEAATWEHHPAFPRPTNPWSPDHWTGVSSSGSGVALAAGFCFAATASDLGGSIRMPSAAGNCTGLKPTWGRVSRHGVMYGGGSYDHTGPMARSAADVAALLGVMAGSDPEDPATLVDPVPDYLASMHQGVRGMTLGVDWNFAADGMAPEIVAALEQAIVVFERLGMRIREVKFPEMNGLTGAPMIAQIALAHADTYPAKAEHYGPALKALMERAGRIRGVDVAAGVIARDHFRGHMARTFAETDFIITPGLGKVLPTWDALALAVAEGDGWDPLLTRFTLPFNATGVPTLSLPGGFTGEGLPIGVQLAGAWLAEPELIRAGVAFQQATDFHLRRPPGA